MTCFICLDSSDSLIDTCPEWACHNLKTHTTCLRELIDRGTTTCAICGHHYTDLRLRLEGGDALSPLSPLSPLNPLNPLSPLSPLSPLDLENPLAVEPPVPPVPPVPPGIEPADSEDSEDSEELCTIPVHLVMLVTIPITFIMGVAVLYGIWFIHDQMNSAFALGLCIGFVFLVAVTIQCQVIFNARE